MSTNQLLSILEDELAGQRAIVSDVHTYSKAEREKALRRVRSIEDTLGVEPTPAVNGRPAAEPYATSDELDAERDRLEVRIAEIDRELEDRANQKYASNILSD